jgi:hypothetical protein
MIIWREMAGKTNEWIRLSKKSKPQEEQWCLVWSERGYDIAIWRRDERVLLHGYFIPMHDWRWWNLDAAEYWMPLPTSPTIEKEK